MGHSKFVDSVMLKNRRLTFENLQEVSGKQLRIPSYHCGGLVAPFFVRDFDVHSDSKVDFSQSTPFSGYKVGESWDY